MPRQTDWSRETSDAERQAMANGRRRWQATLRYRAKHRQAQLAQRLIDLQRETMAAGMIRRLPWGAIEALAVEFGVSESVIRNDIKVIDSWPDPAPAPQKKLRDPRWGWAYSRPRPTHFPRKVSVMLPEELYQQAIAKGHFPTIVRRALETFLDRGQAHTADDCARVVAGAADLGTQDRVVRLAERFERPLVEVLAALVLTGAKREEG
jgi:hypothetical protein